VSIGTSFYFLERSANMNNLKILLTASLNTGKSIEQINTAIKGIEKKVNALKLNIEINDKVLKTLNDFNKQMKEISQTAKNTGKVIESALLPDGTKVTRTYFDGLKNEFSQVAEESKKVKSSMEQSTYSTNQQIKSVRDLIQDYKILSKEAKNYNSDGTLKGKTSTYLNDKGNARVIKTDANDNVVSVKDLENYGNLIKEQEKARKSLQELAVTGRYTTDELRKIGQGINLATSVKQIEQLSSRMKNMRMGTNLTQDQDNLRKSLERVFNQGKVTEEEFNKFNNAINSSKNISELEKLKRELDKTVTSSDAKSLQQKITNDAQKLLRTHANTVDTQGVQEFITRVNGINPASQTALNGLRHLQTELTQFRNNATEAARTSMTFGQQLKVALERVPVWAVATTAIYGTSAAVKDLLDNLILVDGQMTELKRVMSEDTNFDQLLSSAVDMSKELGRGLDDVNNAIILAAKTGANAKDSLDLARTATIASNVSELSAADAMQNLISVTTQFNLKASQSIDVINKLNEVDNQYATSTKDLSDSLAHAGSVAQTYNVTLDEMIGLSTAMQVATRASGAEVGNSLKTIISRLNSGDSLKAMKEVGIYIKDSTNASEIIKSIGNSWGKLTDAQKQNLGVVIAGRFQLSKFLGLFNNYQMAIDSTKTSLNSQNSAVIENQKYLNSMEAKLAELKNSWIEFSLAVGDSGIADVFIGAVMGLTKLANGATSFVKTFGAIPAVFSIASVGALLLSKNLRLFLTTRKGIDTFANTFQGMNNHLSTTRTLIRENTVGLTGFQRVTTATGIAWNTLGASIRGALISTGIGILIAGITFALGKLVEKLIETKREQAKVKQEADKLALSYSLNEDKITSLVSEYKDLQSQVKSGLLSDKDERYLEVQNELNTLLPNLTKNTDKLGNARLKSVSSINSEIEYLQKLSNLESQKFIETFGDTVDKSSEKISGLKAKIDELTNGKVVTSGKFAGLHYTNPDNSAETEIEKLVKQKELKVATDELAGSYKKLGTEYAKVMGYSKDLTQEDQDYIATIVDKNKKNLATEDGMKKVESQIKSFVVTMGEVRKATGDIFSVDEINGFSTKQINSLSSIENSVESGHKNWNKYKDALIKVGFSADIVAKIIDHLKGVTDEQAASTQAATISAEELAQRLSDAQGNFSDITSIILDLTKAGQMNEAMTVAQKDAYSSLADELSPLNGLLEGVANGKQISAAEAMDLIAKEKDLAKAISIENGVVKVNQEAVLKLRTAKIKSYKDMMDSVQQEAINTANATISKLKNYGIEIEAIQNLQDAKKRLAELEDDKNIANSGMGDWGTRDQINKTYDNIKSVADLADNIDKLTAMASEGLAQVGTSEEKLSDSKDKANDTTKESIYVSDEYKKALDEINLSIEKLEKIQSKYPTYSKQYQDALKEEIKQLKEKKGLIDNQTKSLEKQIKSGNIVKTGIVSESDVVDPSSTSSSGMDALLADARKQSSKGTFTYQQIGGDYKGTYKEFLNRALSDCSQFAQEYFEHFLNVKLPRTAAQQWNAGSAVKNGQQRVGDLVFWNTTGKEHSHVGIYSGNGNVMQMGTNGLKEIKVSDISNFEGYRRISGASSSGGGKVTNSSKVWDFLKANGFSDSSAAGVLGNIQQESNFNPTAVNSVSGATGIGQWLGSRLTNLKKYADSQGKSYKSIDTQLEFLLKELNGGDSTTKSKLSKYGGLSALKDMSTEQATKVFEDVFERSGSALSTRQKYAQDNYNKYKGTTSKDRAEGQQSIDEAQSQAVDLKGQSLDVADQIQELIMKLIESNVSSFDHKNKQLEDDFAKIDYTQQRETEGSKEWTKAQLQKEKLLQKEKKNQQDAIKYIQSEIKNNKDLTEAQKALLSDEVIDRTKELYSLEQQILTERQNMAEKIIDTFKQALEAQKQAALDAIDEMVNGINKATEEADYKKNLDKAQSSRQDILDEITSLALDDSASAKKRIDELTKQLQDQDQSIADMQNDKSKNDRLNNLNDQKDQITKHYDDLINDETKFAQMRSDIINANTAQIKKDLGVFYTNIKANSKILGKALSTNLIDLINQANRYLNGKDYKPIKVAQAEKGGILPNWSSNNGRLMYVHPEEMISNKIDTSNILKALDISANFVKNFSFPKMPTFNPNAATAGNTYSINLNVGSLNGTKKDAELFLSEVVKGVKKLGGKI
jgi:TP901 family phage tail tape measure protein